MENLNFGDLVLQLRKEKDWTVRQLIERLEQKCGKVISPAYITRVEQYGEIPSPELICLLADVFGYDQQAMLAVARTSKVKKFDKGLQEKYEKAAGFYRLHKGKK